MAPILPHDILDLRSASVKTDGSFVNVMGLVTDFMLPNKSKGTDYTCQFYLADHTYGTIGFNGEEGLKARCFNLHESNLPPVRRKGDVVILRGVKVTSYPVAKCLMTNRTTTWVVIPSIAMAAAAPGSPATMALSHQRSGNPFPLTTEETRYALELYRSNDPAAYADQDSKNPNGVSNVETLPTATQNGRRQHCLLQDLEVGNFYDLVVQVVKIFPSSGKAELYVTDYTKNNTFWQYREEDFEPDRNGDEHGYLDNHRAANSKWPGPWAKYTMTVTLFPPHSDFAVSSVVPNDFILLRNVHAKWTKVSKTEGVIHTDRYKPDRVNVSVIKQSEDDELVKDLLRRKREYWRTYKKQNPHAAENSLGEEGGTKRKASDDAKPLTKAQRKKQKRDEKKAAAKVNAQRIAVENGGAIAGALSSAKPPEKGKNGLDLNPNIRCAHQTQPLRAISAIKSLDFHKHETPAGINTILPFHNINSRATVRVVSFWPDDLADFTFRQRRKDIEDAMISPDVSVASGSEDEGSASELPSDTDDESSKWVWAFKLQLEDASRKRKGLSGPQEDERLWVTVAAQDAEYLLKLDASDLHKKPDDLAALKERLFCMWGDLEERKTAKLQADNKDQPNGQNNMDVEDLASGVNLAGGPPFECCLKEYGVKVRKHRRSENEPGADAMEVDFVSDGENENDLVPGERGYKTDWIYERRWQMWGCTIV